ncbi:MAG TPA: allophanate hydrolase subunit 1 [Ilumatobacteraceae bacterium]
MRVLDAGPHAFLVELPTDLCAAWANAFRALDVDGVLDVVPAAATVLVRCADGLAAARARLAVDTIDVSRALGTKAAAPVEIPVVYDGADLTAVAAATGLDVESVVRLHAGAEYEVAFLGFAPGFAYLRGLPPALHLPRRATPRTRVDAGSVAIAAGWSAVYPTASPGGWHLLGRTEAVLWDAMRDPPSLFVPGAQVRFVPT